MIDINVSSLVKSFEIGNNILDGARTGLINVLYSIELDVIAPTINPTITGINIDLAYIFNLDIEPPPFYHCISFN